ncbi:MAG: HNH endonuclease, partial [Desulfotomaculales bacterium]
MSIVPLPVEERVKSRSNINSVRKSYCEYCGAEAAGEPHHIRPRSQGRTDTPANLIQLCAKCHSLAQERKISCHELILLIAKRENMKISQVYAAVGLQEPQEEPEEKFEERVKSYVAGLQRLKMDIEPERPLDELVQMLITLGESEEETRWVQGEIVKILIARGAKKSWIAAQIGRSVTYVNNLLITYETFPDESFRNPELKWTHHKIAAVKSKDPHVWINRAADEKMSTRQMERAIALEEGSREEKDRVVRQEEEELREAEKVFEKVEEIVENG